jgi:hypothetical protein
LIEGLRQYKHLPKISKSAIRTYKFFCDYLFYKKSILKEDEGEVGIKANIGTDTHLIFTFFWDKLDFEYIFTLDIDPMLEMENNPVTHYFFSICMTITPEYDRDVGVLQRIFWKFACLHASRFLYLYRLFNGNKNKIWKYFPPLKQEKFYNSDKYGIYGTADTLFLEVDENLNECVFIADYKTGNVPASVLRGPKNVADSSSTELPTKFMFEIHFYGLLYLLHNKWDFYDERIANFILLDEWVDEEGKVHEFGLRRTKEDQEETTKAKGRYLTSVSPRLKRYNDKFKIWDHIEHGDLLVGVIFLSGDPDIHNPVVVKKKFNYKTLRTTLVRINEIKSIFKNRHNDHAYLIIKMKTLPEYNKYKCVQCSRNEKCLEEIADQMGDGN